MELSRSLETDIDLDTQDTQDVKGGGLVSASATVGDNSVSVNDTNVAASAAGTTVGASAGTGGYSASASGHGTSASSGKKTPKGRKLRRKR